MGNITARYCSRSANVWSSQWRTFLAFLCRHDVRRCDWWQVCQSLRIYAATRHVIQYEYGAVAACVSAYRLAMVFGVSGINRCGELNNIYYWPHAYCTNVRRKALYYDGLNGLYVQLRNVCGVVLCNAVIPCWAQLALTYSGVGRRYDFAFVLRIYCGALSGKST